MAEVSHISPPLGSSKAIRDTFPGTRLGFKEMFTPLGLLVTAIVICWLLFFDSLRGEWAVNAQYNYGYAVPFLGLALLWRRWPERPSASVPNGVGWAGILGAALLLLILPFQVVLQANPEWRMVYWINGFQVVVMASCLLYYLGGWGWVWYFSPPLLFMLIAIPWPMEMETSVIQGLMRQVAGWTVEVAGWLGIPAVQHGNLIEVGVGVVGIDEACSGVRSLQSALMLSLFLGEMHRFTWVRRMVLLAASLLLVLFSNLCRTTFLVWAAASHGMHQMETWHDTAGIVVMLMALPGLMGLSYLMKPKMSRTLLERAASPSPLLLPLPRWIGIAALIWIGACLLVTEVWYRAHEAQLVPNKRWSVVWPSQNPLFAKTSLPGTSLAILRCSNSNAASWQDDEGNQWSAFLLRWDPGRNSIELAKGHRPDICFPAAGARLVEDFGETNLAAAGVILPFRHQTFESGPKLLHVFHCLWSDRRSTGFARQAESSPRNLRWQAVLAGERNLGQQVLEIVLQGPDSSQEALATIKRQLPLLVRPQ